MSAIVQEMSSKHQYTTETVLQSMLAKSKNNMVQMPPGIAQRILDELNFGGQRKVRESRALKHLHRIKTGDWRASFPITLAVLPSGVMYLVDGQHRLHAIVRHGAAVPVTVLLSAVDNEAEARRLYSGFDERDSVRSDNEMMDAVGVSDTIGLPRAYTHKLYKALPILRNNLEPATGSEIEAGKYVDLFGVDTRLSVIAEWKPEAAEYLHVIQKTKGRIRARLLTAGSMAVALYTFRYQPIKAHEFWHGIADNDGLRRNDPRSTLLRDMLERSLSTGALRQTVQAPVLAWNAFCEGRELKIIKCVTGGAVAPWGTPLAGRK